MVGRDLQQQQKNPCRSLNTKTNIKAQFIIVLPPISAYLFIYSYFYPAKLNKALISKSDAVFPIRKEYLLRNIYKVRYLFVSCLDCQTVKKMTKIVLF